MRSSINRNHSAGNVMLEFLVIIPLLLVMFMGIVEIGRAFSSMTWVSQSTYLATMRGAELPVSIGELASQNKYIDLHGIQNSALEDVSHDNVSVEYSTANRTVEVTVQNSLIPLFSGVDLGFFQGMNIDFTDTYVAPILLSDPDSIPGAKSSFGGAEPGCWYDCDFVKHCGGNPPDTILCDAPDNSPPPTQGGGGGGGGCFAADTPITLANGAQIPIQMVKKGDLVLSWDEVTDEVTTSRVAAIMTFKRDHHYILNGHLKVTAEHPFRVADAWVPVENLKIGDSFISITGEVVGLQSKQYIPEETRVYNFEVEGTHTYFAAGILVHNRKDYNVNDAGGDDEGGGGGLVFY